jgi:hypothetical protein
LFLFDRSINRDFQSSTRFIGWEVTVCVITPHPHR